MVLACSRPAVRDLIVGPQDEGPQRLDVPIGLRIDPWRLRGLSASVAVVDMGSDPFATPVLCRSLKRQLPATPIVAIVCCSGCLPVAELRSLLEDDVVQSVIGLQVEPGEMTRAISSSAMGQTIVNLELTNGPTSSRLAALLGGSAPEGADQLAEPERSLVTLLTRGLSDQEIGRRLHLSQHTIHHRIHRLLDRLELRNRVQLAAWGGRHGLYEHDERTAPPSLRHVP
jgi:DNA-binding NarL/FixJ family response regulator